MEKRVKYILMYISLDLETTGFDAENDRIIEIGAVKFKGNKIVERYQTIVNPECEIPEIITHITGISAEETKKAPLFREVAGEFKKFVGKDTIIGHNIQFDLEFLRKKGVEFENKIYDTCALSPVLINSPSYSLETLTENLGINHEKKHRALDDAIACMELFNILLGRIEEISFPALEEIKMHVLKSGWQFKDLFLKAKGSEKSTDTDKEEKDGKEEKEEKINIELTEKILEAFENQKNLICEAGIGSKRKKSLLSAAAIQAEKNHERIVISVYDKNSARELKDLSDVETVILESNENYLSTKRFDDFKHKDFFDNDEIALLIKVLLWHKKAGEKSELNLNREERVVFDKISCDLAECDHSNPEIKDGCFFAQAREKAIDADIVITDHGFLLNDSLNQIPNYRYLIVDEADYVEKAGTIVKTFVPEILERKYPQDKILMLFGLLGIFFEKYNKENEFQLVMDEYHYRVIDWQRVHEAAANISPDLANIFTENYDEKTVNWIFQNQEGRICFKSARIDVKERIGQILEQKKSVVFASPTLQVDGSFDFIRTTLGLYENFDEIVYKNVLSENETTEVIPPERGMPMPNTEGNLAKCGEIIINAALENNGKTAVLFTSQRSIEEMYKKTAITLKNKGISVLAQGVTGGQGKILDTFASGSEGHVLFSNFDLWNNSNIKGVSCLILTKIPFDHPMEPIFAANAKRFQDSFMEYSLPRTVIKFRQAVHKLIKANRGKTTVILLDTRITGKEYGKIFLKSLPQN